MAWLALAAMALIVLMPAISRSMPMDGAMAGMSSHADDGCTQHAGHHHAGMPGDPDDPTARCGYCVLLAHTPWVGSGAPITLLPMQPAPLAPMAALPRQLPPAPLLSAHPRGPPTLRYYG